MKITIAIPTNADWARLDKTADCLIRNTGEPENTRVIFVDNCNTFEHDMETWHRGFMEKYRGETSLVVLPRRVGLTSAWKACTDESETDWTAIINDDTYLMPAWDVLFRSLVARQPDHNIFLLCHPYNWSGFAVNRAFVEEFPWRTEFPEGYHEDNDIYLRVAHARGFTTKQDIYTKGIYCLPFNEKSVEGKPRCCFTHSSDNAVSKQSPHYTRWDEPANLAVFNKYWKRCAKFTPGAIENKNGQYFRKI